MAVLGLDPGLGQYPDLVMLREEGGTVGQSYTAFPFLKVHGVKVSGRRIDSALCLRFTVT